MLMMIVLTIVVLICLGIAWSVANAAPLPGAYTKWGLLALCAVAAIACILSIWGIA